jgi:hypothetical protein
MSPNPAAERVIYFPRINPPDNEWFTRVLLYWDEVGTIVPLGNTDDFLDEHARRLVDAGLVRPIPPAPYIGEIRRFEENFLALLEQDAQVGALAGARRARIHMQKFGEGLAAELERRGLAEPARDTQVGGWYDVDPRTGQLFMTYLATALGRLKDLAMAPITDVPDHLALLLGPEGQAGPAEQTQLKVAVLSKALPAPAEGTTPEDIADFKRENGMLIKGFREEVTRRALQATWSAPGTWIELAEVEGSAIASMAAELTGSMRARRWRRIGLGAIGVVGAGLAVVDAVLSGGMLSQVGASTSLVGAAWGAVSDGAGAAPRSPAIAYAAAAAETFGD